LNEDILKRLYSELAEEYEILEKAKLEIVKRSVIAKALGDDEYR
jgi:hypothetical protein